ncbi:MAG: 3-phosphoserine/phosphohydroxythreonine transaminase [SAR324 cluster bacterium]|nr:3-phosphoserine/phosphohydroxythreonine transaminase [SAR324 cluster bacterium]MBL7034508.1 3-phosphoserine/phosphohydroxythreonine transaminase [SAR324 cluster bacterium]
MSDRVYNFSAGPAMLPTPVMERIKNEFLDFQGLGASIVEISHRLPVFREILAATESLFRELTGLPENYKVLFMHGGAQMQFSAVPLNLMSRNSHIGSYFITGRWGTLAEKEARKYGNTEVLMDGKEAQYRQIPQFDSCRLDQESSYAHLTTNNTLYGTRWHTFPDTGNVPLVADATSDILSREMDYSLFGVVYAGLQKNLGTSGTGLVVIREDLLGHALPETPKLLDYALLEEHSSIPNTINVFAVYVMRLVLEWVKEQGGVAKMEKLAEQKSGLLYQVLDQSEFYSAVADSNDRSTMNVTFHLPQTELLEKFLTASDKEGLFALRGHAAVGGARASIYNAMPPEGVEALAQFMKEFERKHG